LVLLPINADDEELWERLMSDTVGSEVDVKAVKYIKLFRPTLNLRVLVEW